ncbi:MAG TPA: flagellar hook-length control protein FliK [Anaerolineaceae bacterium]|nr:flagellar hook-length control protein FliK [Anaerolineaceae bacterium]
MLINGPPIVNNTGQTNDANLSLRVNQRLVAEVLKIAGDSITLSIEGVHIVAKLTSQDQAAALQEHRIAQFIVRDLASNNVLLHLVSPATIIPNWAEGESEDLAGILLKSAGLPLTKENLAILRAMLSQGMKADPEVIFQLSETLQQLGSWGEEEAGIAAALKNAGLPISPEIIKLIKDAPSGISNSISDLIVQLQALSRQTQNPQLSQSARSMLEFLRAMILPWDAPPAALAEKLNSAISLLGRSLENQLSDLVGKDALQTTPAPGMTSNQIAAFRQELIHTGLLNVVDDLDKFFENLRYIHFLNSGPGAQADGEHWASLEVPLRLALNTNAHQPGQSSRWYDASLKIAYEKNGESCSINPEFTQLVIQLNLEKNDVIEVSLSIAGRKVSAQVASTSKELKELAEQEIPSLAEGLAQFGFSLQGCRCLVGAPTPLLGIQSKQIDPLLLKNVNIVI